MDSERPPRILWAILALTVVVGVGMAAPVSLPSENAMLPEADGSATQTATPATPTGSVVGDPATQTVRSATATEAVTRDSATRTATSAPPATPTESVVVEDSETFVVEPTGDEGSFEYRFTVDGEVSPVATDDGDLEATDRIVPHDNGTVTVVGVADAPAGDAYDVDGTLLGFDRPASGSPDQSAVRLAVDDTDVTVNVVQNVAVERTDVPTDGESPTPETETETPDTETTSETATSTSETDSPTSDDGTDANDDFDTARPIAPGTYEQVEVGDDGRDYYAIDVDEGDVINAWLPDPQSMARLEVYGSDREQIERTMITSGDTWISTPPLRAGTYYLVAEPETGPYSFGLSTTPDDDRFEPNNDPDGATRIEPGRYDDLRITDGETDTFAVEAEAGQRVRVTIAFDHDTGNLDIAHYFDSDYVGSFSETDGESYTHELRTSGPFVFEVLGTDGASAPYSMEVTILDESSSTSTSAETEREMPSETERETSPGADTETQTETDTETRTETETQTRTDTEAQTQTDTEARTTTARTTVPTTESPTGTVTATPSATAAGTTSTGDG